MKKIRIKKTTNSILRILLDKNFSREDCLIAVGGGITGDVSGFAASLFKRGLKFINIPTTLLSQVDSSIGGKTGINTNQGKNLIRKFSWLRYFGITNTSINYSNYLWCSCSRVHSKLFIAGIIPGIMIALIFMSYVIIWSLINKKECQKFLRNILFRKNQEIKTTFTSNITYLCSYRFYIYWSSNRN